MTNPINNFNPQSFPSTPLKVIKSIGWVILAILALPSSLVGYQHSRLLLGKAVAIWSENENPTTGKTSDIIKQALDILIDDSVDVNYVSGSFPKETSNRKNIYIQPITGKKLGIEGRENGCVPSAILMGLFAITTLTDFLLESCSNDTSKQKEFKGLLKDTVVQPLRSKGFVSEKAFNQIRSLVSANVGSTMSIETFMEKFLEKIGKRNYVYKSYGLYEKSLAEMLGCKLSYSSLFEETIKLEDIFDNKSEEDKVKDDSTLITFNVNRNQDEGAIRAFPPQTIYLEDRLKNKIKMRLLSLQMMELAHCKTILFSETEAYYYDSQSFSDKKHEIQPSIFMIKKLIDEFPKNSSSKVKKINSLKEGNRQMEELFLTALRQDYPNALEKAHLDIQENHTANDLLDGQKSEEEFARYLDGIEANKQENDYGIDDKFFSGIYGTLTTKEIACNYIKISDE